jgi:hypothetical protein
MTWEIIVIFIWRGSKSFIKDNFTCCNLDRQRGRVEAVNGDKPEINCGNTLLGK